MFFSFRQSGCGKVQGSANLPHTTPTAGRLVFILLLLVLLLLVFWSSAFASSAFFGAVAPFAFGAGGAALSAGAALRRFATRHNSRRRRRFAGPTTEWSSAAHSCAMALAVIKSPSTTPTIAGCPVFITWCSLNAGFLGEKIVWPRTGYFGILWRTEQAAHGTSRKPFPIVTVLLSDPVSTPIYMKRGKTGIDGQNGSLVRKAFRSGKNLPSSGPRQ